MSAWLRRWWDQIFASFLLAKIFMLFPLSSPRPCPFNSAPSFTLISFTNQHSTFPLSTTKLFHTLLLHSLAAAAFLFLSSHPPTSCPTLLQIWGFDTDFPSNPFLHTFLCFLYLSLKCWSHLAVFLCLPDWWREPVRVGARSSGHMMDLTESQHLKKGR